MVYKDFSEWFKANTENAYRIAKKLEESDREEVETTLDWTAFKLEECHKMINWLESAVKQVCSKKDYEAVQKLYMTYVHNDFAMNSPVGQELCKSGQIKAKGIQMILMPKDE